MNVVVANGGAKVNVFTNVFDSSDAGIAAVKLYYYVDSSRMLAAAPALNIASLYPALPRTPPSTSCPSPATSGARRRRRESR